MTVAVLFSRKRSVYKSLPDVDVYDINRNALTFDSDLAVIAHPPCRNWGRFYHWSKGTEQESELAIFAIQKVRKNGGVLEHPAYSKLWAAAGLPLPGEWDVYGGTTLSLWQCFWGHRAPKHTWLYVVGIPPGELPDVLRSGPLPSQRIEKMCLAEREKTPLPFALFLIDLAKRCKPSKPAISAYARVLPC